MTVVTVVEVARASVIHCDAVGDDADVVVGVEFAVADGDVFADVAEELHVD